MARRASIEARPGLTAATVNPEGAMNGTPRPFDPRKPLVFMHVPKSAGSAFIQALVMAGQPHAVFCGFDRALFGGFNAFADLSEQARQSVYLDTNTLPKGADFVAAHMSFSTLTCGFPEGQLVTVLREPISRLLSLWLYWRSTTDDQLQPWGLEWGNRVRNSRRPLFEFLSAKDIACQTDNQVVRMLLWPHPLIPGDSFIDKKHDAVLVQLAKQRLLQFSFLDFIENPYFESNVSYWLKRRIGFKRYNETANIPNWLKTPISEELTEKVWALLDTRSRLDLAVWIALAANRIPQIDPLVLQREAVGIAVLRHSRLMENDPTP